MQLYTTKGTSSGPTARSASSDCDIPGQKRLVRIQILAARDSLPIEERQRKSRAVCRALEPLLADATRDGEGRSGHPPLIAAYAPMKSELDLSPLIESEHMAAWEWCFPCMVTADEAAADASIGALSATSLRQHAIAADEAQALDPRDSATRRTKSRMEFFRVPHAAALARTAPFLAHPMRSFERSALENEGFIWVSPREIDAVLVPLVGFDAHFNRLGYGGGNYDRFLAELRKDALVIGAAFEEQRVSSIPCETHDRPLPLVVSA